MATFSSSSVTGKRSSTSTLSPAGKRLRTASPTSLVFSSVSFKLLTAFLEGKGLVISPPLPIICNPSGYLKSINLSSVGLGLDAIPFEFGWNLIVWKPFGKQSEPKAVLGPNEADIEVVDVLDESSPSEGDSDSVRVEIESEPISEQREFETGPEPVPEYGEIGVEPPRLFEEDVDDSFDRVANFEKQEVVEIPILAVQPSTQKVSQPSEGQKKKRIKTPIGRTYLPLVPQFKLCKLQLPLLPHILNPPSQNPQSNLQENHSGYLLRAPKNHSKKVGLPNSFHL